MRYGADETVTISEVTLRPLLVGVEQMLSEEAIRVSNLRVKMMFEPMFRAYRVSIHGMLASQVLHDESVTFPTTWWDAFKLRWFPRWALRRWPAHETTVRMEARALYPKIALPDFAAYQKVYTYPVINYGEGRRRT